MIRIPTQSHAATQFPTTFTKFPNTTSTNWNFLQPGLPNLASHLIENMGASFDPTIIEDNLRLATLCSHLCPTATVLRCLSVSLLKLLLQPSVPVELKAYILDPHVNLDISKAPINNRAFLVQGIDITISSYVRLPLIPPLSAELQTSLCIIIELGKHRSLAHFVLLLLSDEFLSISLNLSKYKVNE